VVTLAERTVHDTGIECVATIHLLQALLEVDDPIAADILARHGVDRSSFDRETNSGASAREMEGGRNEDFTQEALTTLRTSLRHALAMGQNEVAPEHILLALASVPAGAAGMLLAQKGIDVSKLRSELTRIANVRRDAYFESFPLEISRDLHRVLVATIGHAEATGARKIDLSDLMFALSRDREIPLLRRAEFDEATLLSTPDGG
jgi:ATP-dependent Clp protease ATP-binding subunit ClpA